MIGCRNPMGNFLELFIDKRKHRFLSRLRTGTWQPEPCAGHGADVTGADNAGRRPAELLHELPGTVVRRAQPTLPQPDAVWRHVGATDRDQLASRRQ